MTARSRGTSRARGSFPSAAWLAPTVLGLLLLTGLVPAASAAPVARSGSIYTPTGWNNTAVECMFNATAPSATVSSMGSIVAGLWMEGATISAANALGVGNETATMSAATWTAANLTTTAAYSVEYSARVPVVGLLGLTVGTMNATVSFSLRQPTASASPPSDVVSVVTTVSDWPWQLLYPQLRLNLSVTAANPATEHLTINRTSGLEVLSANNATGRVDAFVRAPSSANGTTSGGLLKAVALVGTAIGSIAGSVTLSLTANSSAYQDKAIEFVTPVTVVPAKPIGSGGPLPGAGSVPLPDLAAAGAAGIVASLAVAGVTRRARHAPSRLEFVEEEE